MSVPVDFFPFLMLYPQNLRDVLKVIIHILRHLNVFRCPVNFQNLAAPVFMLVISECPDGLYEKKPADYRADYGLDGITPAYFSDLLVDVVPCGFKFQ